MTKAVVGTVASLFLAAPFVPSVLASAGVPDSLPWHGLVSLLTLVVAALLFFVRSWMGKREKSEDGFRADMGGILSRVVSVEESIKVTEERLRLSTDKLAESLAGLGQRLSDHFDNEEGFQARTIEAQAKNVEAHEGIRRDLFRLEAVVEREVVRANAERGAAGRKRAGNGKRGR